MLILLQNQLQIMDFSMPVRALPVILLLAISNTCAATEFWKCEQKNGKVVYTNMPCPEGSKKHTVSAKNEVRYVQNSPGAVSAPTSFLDDIKKFYHRMFPGQKTEAPPTTAINQPAPMPAAPSRNTQSCINRNRTQHFDNLKGVPKIAFNSAEGC